MTPAATGPTILRLCDARCPVYDVLDALPAKRTTRFADS